MNLVFLVLECVTKKYATFSGRAKRMEYWLFFLFYMLMIFIGGLIDGLLGTYDLEVEFFLFMFIFGSLLSIPLLSVHIRRLHDINKSGYWWFIIFVPLIGFFWSIILSCLSGTKGANDFGSDDGNPGITSKQQRLEGFVKRLERLEEN
jgi:uncharacterized membrane protein YhaH (DUF805 family)